MNNFTHHHGGCVRVLLGKPASNTERKIYPYFFCKENEEEIKSFAA
jgi:hypothetical protein